MTNEKQSYVKKTMAASKDVLSRAFDKTQAAAEKTIDYNHELCLAGLGVFADARIDGKQALDTMVGRGEEFETKARQKLDAQSAAVKEKITAALDKVSGAVVNVTDSVTNVSKPSISLDDLYDTRVARVITRLGTPAASKLDTVIEQLTDISAKLNEMAERNQEVAEVEVAS